jgi:O-antigen/teichoic acid export membrane protein
MSEAVRIRRNSLFSFLSVAIRLMANILLFLIIARFYGAETFGQFTFAHTLATMFILFADFGFDVLLTTEIARNKQNAPALFQTFFSLKVVFCLIALFGMWIIAFIENISESSRLLVLIFSFYVGFTTLTNFLFALFKGFEKLQYETKISFFINITLFLILIVLAIKGVSIFIIAITFVLTRVFGLIISVRTALKILPQLSFALNFEKWKEVRSQVFVFGTHLLFGSLYFQLDTLLLAFWKGDREVGVYQAVFKLVALPLMLPDIFINTLMPVLSRLHIENRERWSKLGYLLNKTLTLAALPVSMIIFTFAEYIIKIVYGKSEYNAAIPVLRIFAIILFIRFFVESYALMLTTSHRQHKRMIVVISATFLNLFLNFFLIRSLGVLGAAVTSIITNTFVGICYIFITWPLAINWLIRRRIILLILIALVFCVVIDFLKLNVFLSIGLVAAYLIFHITFAYTKEEKQIIFSDNIFKSFVFKNSGDKL